MRTVSREQCVADTVIRNPDTRLAQETKCIPVIMEAFR